LERCTVSRDRRERSGLVADVALCVAVVLVCDHDNEGEQQPKQRSDYAEEL